MTQPIKKLLEARSILFAGLFYTLAASVAMLYSTDGLPTVKIPYIDKLVHLIIHAGLSIVWLSFFYVQKQRDLKIKNIILVLLSCAVYGIIIEILQEVFTLTRRADIADVVANLVGSTCGFVVFQKIKRRLKI